jgi:alpha-N-acetylglucosaminidase
MTEYNPDSLEKAWGLLLKAAGKNRNSRLAENSNYLWDLVDVTRQVLSNRLIVVYDALHKEIRKERVDAKACKRLSRLFLEIVDQMDRVLATNKHFLLGTWLASARDLGITKAEKDLFEFNARNLVTLWGPNGEINDYASRQWSGLISDYYKVRWEMFLTSLDEAVDRAASAGTRVDFNEGQIETKMRNFELSWQQERSSSTREQQNGEGSGKAKFYPVEAVGNSLEVIRKIFEMKFSLHS